MARWFTSDLHFGHANILGYCDRPFQTVEEMDEEIISRWNKVVGFDDEVWVLGDWSLGGNFERSLGYVERLNGSKILLPGNHDKNWRGKLKGRADDSVYLDAGFARIEHGNIGVVEFQLGDHEVLLSHFPYGPTGRYDHRYSAWHADNEGKFLLHGHVHATEKMFGPNEIHVGIDAWDYFPASENAIVDLINDSCADATNMV